MRYEKLSLDNVDKFIEYLTRAMKEEPGELTFDSIDEKDIKRQLKDSFYQTSNNILAIDDNNVVGRIEYHFYGCLPSGYRMAYVDWVYVLPCERHNGVGQKLFSLFEDDCIENGINQYRLLRLTNPNANRFYSSFKNVELLEYPALDKYLK